MLKFNEEFIEREYFNYLDIRIGFECKYSAHFYYKLHIMHSCNSSCNGIWIVPPVNTRNCGDYIFPEKIAAFYVF